MVRSTQQLQVADNNKKKTKQDNYEEVKKQTTFIIDTNNSAHRAFKEWFPQRKFTLHQIPVMRRF